MLDQPGQLAFPPLVPGSGESATAWDGRRLSIDHPPTLAWNSQCTIRSAPPISAGELRIFRVPGGRQAA